ncbi:MAG TPA: phosphate acyltransferase PlsX [Candidatus Sulfotelmatobacter sp.]|nr:phosphate acyltransferase PlsX [Candidatus Sulfotelmatobacter sp.]
MAPPRDLPPAPMASREAEMGQRRPRVAVDAMGGDLGSGVVVAGAVQAARELGTAVTLVGQETEVRRHLGAYPSGAPNIAVLHAPETVAMDESPSMALRRKKQSSIRIGLELLKRGEADAFVSAGNTGAVMATALVVLGPLPGVERPAIAIVIPTKTGRAVLLDAGANVDCKPRHLHQFGIMGSVYAEAVLGTRVPRVGLLSIGEEESKGNELTREAFKELEEEAGIRFIGNVEGRDVFNGQVDVVVCDGFTGNVALKIGEGVAEIFVSLLREELTRDFWSRAGALLVRRSLHRFKRRLDYSEYGGAPLFGVDGVCIIGHGRSSPKAIKNAIRVAGECVTKQVIPHIRDGIAGR